MARLNYPALGGGGVAGLPTTPLFKLDRSLPAFEATNSNQGIQIRAGSQALVEGQVFTFADATAITTPTHSAGTDYAIWIKPSGDLESTVSFTSPPVAGSVRLGGYHYAPGSNAAAQAGGNTTPQINPYSIWDLEFRPDCPDPRGMTLVSGSFWSAIYFLGVNHLTNGPSRYGVTIADGGDPPKVPLEFGGDGTSAYANGSWWNMAEVLSSHGLRLPFYHEFQVLAYGTTENTSRGVDPVTTGLNFTNAGQDERFTSKWGVIQSSGCLLTWGLGHSQTGAGASFANNTQSRGQAFSLPHVPYLGGDWPGGGTSGSRYSAWNQLPSFSAPSFSARGVANHYGGY